MHAVSTGSIAAAIPSSDPGSEYRLRIEKVDFNDKVNHVIGDLIHPNKRK